MLDHDLVLKSGELYLVGNTPTDGSREHANGLYLRDTRHLCHFRVTVNGIEMETLSAVPHDATHGVVVSANPHFRSCDGEVIPAQHVLLEQAIKLDDRMYVNIILQNFYRLPVKLNLDLEIAADFRDLFDIRGFPDRRAASFAAPGLRTAKSRSVTRGWMASSRPPGWCLIGSRSSRSRS